MARLLTESPAGDSQFLDASIEYLPLGGRWRTFDAAGNYAKNLRSDGGDLVVLADGLERAFPTGEQVEFASDFDSLTVGVNADTYLDMILDYLSSGATASRPLSIETGDSSHGF